MLRWILISLVGTLAVWFVLLVGLYLARPETRSLSDAAKVLPDTLRLVKRLATDRAVPKSAHWALWGLLAYLALPIDLVPDFLPVIGWADDLILASLVLGYLIRRAGPDAVLRHWPGSAEGLATLARLLRLRVS